MSYERLNIQDFVDKWDVAKVQHLEDGIVANEEAIERYHNDSVVRAQSDWEQSDPTAKDYVKNRTHYKENKTYLIADNFETTCSERQYEVEGIVRFLEPNNFPFNLLIENMEPTTLKVFVNGEPIKVVNYNEFGAIKEWHLENDLTITYYYYMPKGEPSEPQFSWRVVPDVNFEAVNGQKFNLTVTIDDVIYVPIDEKYMPKSVLEWQQPVDWNCNDVNDPTYIKNRTHYDYWDQGNRIYDVNFDNGGTLPYTFQVTKEGKGWLGGHGFMYNDCLFNSDSNWEKIGDEYDETLEIWKTKYKCQQTQNRYGYEETLTINATTYSQYISEKDEWDRFVTIDCEYEGDSAIELYEAEMRSKTLDKRFLADFSVEKDWNINDSTNPRYIENRTHYPYLGQGEALLFDAYDSERYEEYNYLPYTQIIQSDLIETDCPGYWLGKEAGYWINIGDPDNPFSYLLDAYSDWKKVGEEDNIIIYQCQYDDEYPCILTVAVQPVEGSSNEYEVELRSATYSGEAHFGVTTAKKMYKTLDVEYLPDGLAFDIDWAVTDTTSPSYIKNKPFDELPEVLTPVFDQTVEAAGQVADAPHELWNGLYKVTINDTDIQYVQAETRRVDYGWEDSIQTDYVSCTHRSWYEGEGSEDFYYMYIKNKAPVPCKITIQKVYQKYELIQLDEKFIPNEIARVSQIEEAASEIASEIDGLQWSDFGEYYKPGEVVVGEKHEDEYHGVSLFGTTTIKGLDGTSLENGDVVTINIDAFGDTYSSDVTVDNYEMSASISSYGIIIDITYDPEANEYYIRNRNDEPLPPEISLKITRKEIHEYYPLKDEYIPGTIARAPKAVLEDVTEAPTAEQYNALLNILRDAGILATN